MSNDFILVNEDKVCCKKKVIFVRSCCSCPTHDDSKWNKSHFSRIFRRQAGSGVWPKHIVAKGTWWPPCFFARVSTSKEFFERELALLVALQGESIWKGGGGTDIHYVGAISI